MINFFINTIIKINNLAMKNTYEKYLAYEKDIPKKFFE